MKYAISLALLFLFAYSYGQDSAMLNKALELPDRFVPNIDKKISELDKQLTNKTDAYLKDLAHQEDLIRKKLAKIDSSKAAALFKDSRKTYEQLSKKLQGATGKADRVLSGEYLPYLDSLKGSLGFLKDAKNILSRSKDIQQKLGGSLDQIKQLQNKFDEAAQIKQYLQQRQQQLQQMLSSYTNLPKSLTKYLGRYQQSVYYYSKQLQEYKQLLNDPDKLVREVIHTLQTIPAFQRFMDKYGMLAGIFAPASSAAAPDPRLPTRDQVMGLVQQRIASGGANGQQVFNQQMQSAQSEISKLKKKLGGMGLNSGDGDMPMPAYRPDQQKTKTFLQRIEYGFNMSSQRATNYFPVTTDIAASAGYKINDKSIVGVALSGKLGLGKDWKHIRITGQGIGLRAFVDWKISSPFGKIGEGLWLTGGAELNYTKPVESLSVFKNYSTWSKSAMVGISKKYKVSKKLKGNMQVLYDFLHQTHTPPTPAIVWRVGYSF